MEKGYYAEAVETYSRVILLLSRDEPNSASDDADKDFLAAVLCRSIDAQLRVVCIG